MFDNQATTLTIWQSIWNEFDNQAQSTIVHELGIDKKHNAALHSQANGIVARPLEKCCGKQQTNVVRIKRFPLCNFTTWITTTVPSATRHSTWLMAITLAHPRLFLAPAATKSLQTARQLTWNPALRLVTYKHSKGELLDVLRGQAHFMLRTLLWCMQICGIFFERALLVLLFHACEMIVYKQFQSTTSSDKEQEGIGGKSNFFLRTKMPKKCPPGYLTKLQGNCWQDPHIVVKCL